MHNVWVHAIILALALFTWEAAGDDAQATSGLTDLTPAKLAGRIEETMARFSAVEYEAEYTIVRDTNAFMRNREPLLVTGTGNYLYRADGLRWYADDEGFTTSVGKTKINPRRTIDGFDGKRHFHDNGSKTVFGEDTSSNSRLEPPAVFWRGSRTSGWLLSALRWQGAKVDRYEKINGVECLVVVSVRAQDRNQPVGEAEVPYWKYEIAVAPSRSFLPLRTRVEHRGKLYSDEIISELAQANNGLWYPVKLSATQHQSPVPYKSKTVHVKSLRIRDDFADGDFQYDVPLGRDVVDRTAGYAWHNDPWWEELRPWLRENLDWPRRDFRALTDLRSYVEPGIDGRPAPPIDASQWLNHDPGAWNRANRQVTLVYFFGGRLISPTPRQIGSIKALESRYGDSGLDVVGIVPGDSDPAIIRQTLDELNIDFPVAIDGDDGSGYGPTFRAFQLQTYTSTFVIDSAGIVHALPADQPPANASLSPVESLVRQSLAAVNSSLPEPSSAVSGRLDKAAVKAIDAEWKRRVRAAKGHAAIRGTVVLTPGQPVAGGVTVEIKPSLWMLSSNTPGGWYVNPDRQRNVRVLSGPTGNYSLEGLRRGTYTLTFGVAGLASIEREIRLDNDHSTTQLDVRFSQGSEIKGRVLDADGTPIRGATVKAIRRHFDPANPERYTTAHLPREPRTTDENGKFHFNHLFDGSYTFEVTAEGFEEARTEPIGAGVVEARVVLKPKAATEVVEDGSQTVSDAVKATNAEAAKHPVSRRQAALTEQHVVNVLRLFEKPADLSEEDYQGLKNIVETRRIPKNVSLRPFLRYDDHSFVQHGWWVMLILERKDRGPFGLWIRKQPLFTRPYTQAERRHHESVRSSGGMSTLGRLITWFKEDPKFHASPPTSSNYEELAEQVRAAVAKSDAEAFLDLFYWEGVGKGMRKFVEGEVAAIVERQIETITIEPKRYTGRLDQWQGFQRFGPNLPVEAYLVLVLTEPRKGEPVSLSLEAGTHDGTPKLVCHVVDKDRTPEFIGKRLSGPITVRGFTFSLDETWLETGSSITAPRELKWLEQANLELWRVPR